MNHHKNEIATGILVLATLGLLLAVLVFVGMPGLVHPLKTHRIYFDNAQGIRPGAPVLLAGREIGKVILLESPVPRDERPPGHEDYEVSIKVRVDKEARIYKTVTVRLMQQGLMGQQVIDFVGGDDSSGLAENKAEFIGERVPDVTEAVANNMERLTGPESDFALTIKNIKEFMEALNQSQVTEVIQNTEELTDTLKREPWRLVWPSTKKYGDEKNSGSGKPASANKRKPSLHKATGTK